MECWKGFKGTTWKRQVDVRDFIQSNYVPYEGDESFLASPTEATKTLWAKVMDYMKKELLAQRAPANIMEAIKKKEINVD